MRSDGRFKGRIEGSRRKNRDIDPDPEILGYRTVRYVGRDKQNNENK